MNANNINVSQNSACKRIKRNFTKILLIAILSFLTFSPAFAQYELKLDWQKKIANGYFISSLTKSDSDSLLYISGGDGPEGPFTNYIISASDGTIVEKFDSDFAYETMYAKKDGSFITVGSTNASSIGIVDTKTFQRTFWSKVPNYRNFTFNEKQNKIVANSSASLIRIYDLATKEIVKEFTSSYFKFSDLFIEQANITDDGKKIVYSYWTSYKKQDGTQGIINFLRIIDMEGNVLKKIDSTSSTKFAITNDGKTLVYFDLNATQLLDLETMQLKEGVPNDVIGYGDDPNCMELSSNDKMMFIGGGVTHFDLEQKKRNRLREGNAFTTIKLNLTNSILFCNASKYFYKFNLSPSSSVSNEHNKIEFTLQVSGNSLFLKSIQEIRPDLQFNIAGVDGRFQKNILQNEIQIVSYGLGFDITNLNSGSYFLQIVEKDIVVASLKFQKIN